MTDPGSGGEFLTTGPLERGRHLLLAHGAGAPMTSPFLTLVADGLDRRGLTVHRFEFAYMAARRTTGRRLPPPNAERLVADYAAALSECRARIPKEARLFAGGKSMGGRIASLVAAEDPHSGLLAGLVVLGYPFHPPGKPGSLRTAHLDRIRCPALIVQGTRDPLGTRVEVEGYGLPTSLGFAWIEDGDHDLKPRAKSGVTPQEALEQALLSVDAFTARFS